MCTACRDPLQYLQTLTVREQLTSPAHWFPVQMVPEEVTIEAWYMDDSDADQRLPHRWGRLCAC